MIELNVTNLVGGNIVITTPSSGGDDEPTIITGHEETWYKYQGDTEWRTVMIGGEIAPFDDMGFASGQIATPENIIAIEIGTGTQANPVTSIGYCGFSGCEILTNVVIPPSVTSIGVHAFYYCIGLTSVTFMEKAISNVQGMTGYPFDLNMASSDGVTIHCTDGDIPVSYDG